MQIAQVESQWNSLHQCVHWRWAHRNCFLSLQYQGAFEPAQTAPQKIFYSSTGNPQQIITRLHSRNPWRFSSAEFAVSLRLPKAQWRLVGQKNGWFFFSSSEHSLGIWTSLPASWMHQSHEQETHERAWEELWTFGSHHVWLGRLFLGAQEMKKFQLNEASLSPLKGFQRRLRKGRFYSLH
ncbi:MAG: hypothetical protein MI717_09090 [Spirochaetales bacterium]|nr:hypothetical protein [Spirochaetales bacterium]